MGKEKSVEGVIDRFEEDLAVIKVDFGEIVWPKDKLPKGVGEGSVIHLKINSDKEETENKEELAKSLLKEILKDSS
ncbi:MAG: DUF3006 family protein [Candidatus Aenigmarchaeota archaeon]|nr:DUF3006 family protein [Candidatus Aenigmarchaeota archaeon]